MSKLTLKNITKDFGSKKILRDINLEVDSGQIIAIKGKSGVGKSTLLNIIAGLETPTSGLYQFHDLRMNEIGLNELAKVRGDKIGYISQFSPMVSKLTALENIQIPILFKKNVIQQKELENKILELADLFQINHLLGERIEKLSGGEIQRVGIIRSLINFPELIVADEPTGSLDDDTALIVLNFLQQMKKGGTIVVLATHSSIVADNCDYVYSLTQDGLYKK